MPADFQTVVSSMTSFRISRRLAAAGMGLILMLAIAPDASAQAGDELLRALKPWIKRQLLGESPAETETVGSTDVEQGRTAMSPMNPVDEAGDQATDSETAAAPDAEPDTQDAAAPAEAVVTSDPDVAELEALVNEALREPDADAAAPVEPALPPPLRFALLAGRSTAITMATVAPLADEISAMVGRPVEFVAMGSLGAMIDAQVERRIDGGFYTASAYALAESRCNCLEPVVAPRASDGTTAYYAIIVTRPGSDIESASDLTGKTVALGAADSLGARRMQLAGMLEQGIDPATTLGGVYEVASAIEAVRMVRDGAADAAFAWSSLNGDAASGYSRGTLSQMVTEGELTMADVVIVWRSTPLTHGPFAVLKTLEDDAKDKIGGFFLALEAAQPEAYDLLNPFYAGGYAPVDAADFSGLEVLVAENVDALRLPKAADISTSPDFVPASE